MPNPSFEQFDTCPYDQNQIHFATGWSNYNYIGSPDYFNSCSTQPWFSVPYNWGGYQQAASGNAYAGIYTYESPAQNFGEYIGAQLLSPLAIGTKYYFSFKTNLALDTNHTFNQATNNIGMLFSTIQYGPSNPVTINNFAHLNSTDVITDTMNWTTISGSFIADSVYKYVIIGRFFDDVQTTIIQMQDTISDRSAYYYIDDIYLSTDSITGGIAEQDIQGSILTYPNPFYESSNIEINCDCGLNNSFVSIINMWGHEEKKYLFVSRKIIINREDLLAGVYFLKIEIDDKVFTQKIIIIN
ncbi:MAG: T9SS type A sorting domain-containing protein [Bacteroidetes bacterium]|nr:T9SS type A sorting domain-containing protein [Bacteroidota bacterium]